MTLIFPAGVDVSPQEHADARLAQFRQACVDVSLLDAPVDFVRYGLLYGNRVGNIYAVIFSDEKFQLLVHCDEVCKNGVFEAEKITVRYL